MCACLPALASAAAPGVVRDREVRFQVVTSTLIRLEYSAERRFEDRRSMTAINRSPRPPRYEVRRSPSRLEIRTRRLTLRYRRGSGPFSAENLTLRLRGRPASARPSFPPPPPPSTGPPSTRLDAHVSEVPEFAPRTSGNLGGWYRALDVARGPVELHDGLLSRDGWYLLDDTDTVLLSAQPPGFAERPARDGPYQDGYLFAYGHDYGRGLADLRLLTGAAPLLPRKAFGVWFSRYFAYRQADYPPLLARFREQRVPLDVLPVDTDFKAPHNWNGWDWNRGLFPDPEGFLAWAHGEGIDVPLNVHPSITSDDPGFAEAESRAGRPLTPDPTIRCRTITLLAGLISTGTADVVGDCRVFDWARAGDLDAYFSLHEPFERAGADFWWLDWCCDESFALAAGLTQDTWINHIYARRSAALGSRWPVLSRIGASFFEPDAGSGSGIWAEHRNAIHFTGDTQATWEMLDFQTVFTAAEGNVGIPYVSHDIGSFNAVTADPGGRHLPDDLYVRWVQSGAFQPILRLHSDHGDRLPWEYGPRAEEIATKFLRLRGALVPYVYTLARRAHDTGLPIVRGTYLHWPERDGAYVHDRQYMLGPQLLVAPVGTPGDPATKEVWFPPGEWTDIFSGERHRGPGVETLSVPLDRMPVFARSGAIVPLQAYRPDGNTAPPRRLIIEAYPGRRGSFTLYEDAGDGLAYEKGRFARTRISQRRGARTAVLRIGLARGDYPGRPRRRAHELRLLDLARPCAVSIGGHPLPRREAGKGRGWSYDADRDAVVVSTGAVRTDEATRVVVRARRGAGCAAT